MLTLPAGTGCQFKAGPSTESTDPPRHAWHPRPATMRFLPSTTIRPDTDQRYLHANIEFTDDLGDTVKAVGTLRFELQPATPAGGTMLDTVQQWNVPLITLQEQQRYYDRISRAYRMQLAIRGSRTLPANYRVRATFMPIEGPRLQAHWSPPVASP